MPDPSPSETLRAAAARLRAAGDPEHTVQEPTWRSPADNCYCGPGAIRHTRGTARCCRQEDGTRRTMRAPLVSPAVAEPLAAWLDVELDRVECGYRTEALPHALAFARSILEQP